MKTICPAVRAAYLQQTDFLQTNLTECMIDQYSANSAFNLPRIQTINVAYEFSGLYNVEKPLKDQEIDKINAVLGTFFAGKLPGPAEIEKNSKASTKHHFQIALKSNKEIRNFLLTLFFEISDKSKQTFAPHIEAKEHLLEIQWKLPASSILFINQSLGQFFEEVGPEVIDNNFQILLSVIIKNYYGSAEKLFFPFCLRKLQQEYIRAENSQEVAVCQGSGNFLLEEEFCYDEDTFLNTVYGYNNQTDFVANELE